MEKFVPKDKMSKKARKRLAAQKRVTWDFSPVTQRVESKKRYDRKKLSRAVKTDGTGDFYGLAR